MALKANGPNWINSARGGNEETKSERMGMYLVMVFVFKIFSVSVCMLLQLFI